MVEAGIARGLNVIDAFTAATGNRTLGPRLTKRNWLPRKALVESTKPVLNPSGLER